MAKKSTWSPLVLVGMIVVLLAAIGAVAWAYVNREDQPIVVPTEQTDETFRATREPATEAEIASTEHAVSDEGILVLAIQRFQMGMGRYPLDLDELLNKPAYLEQRQRWTGPYVNNPRLLEDSWDQPLQFACPGIHNESSYDIWSVGPDGQNGTKDDIGNW